MRKNTDLNPSYFIDFINLKKELINESYERLEKDSFPDENRNLALNRIFVKKLEILIAHYTKGTSLQDIKGYYREVINAMKRGWDQELVKFKKGRAQIVLDQYWLNHYCYMVWMISLGLLLDVSKSDKNFLESVIQRDSITDELLLFLLSHLVRKEYTEFTKTTYKPFKLLYKKDNFEDLDGNDIKKYLDKWHKNTKLLTWHNYRSSINRGSKYYFGYWSFESAAMVACLNIDDRNFENHQYYPGDLVKFYRGTLLS